MYINNNETKEKENKIGSNFEKNIKINKILEVVTYIGFIISYIIAFLYSYSLEKLPFFNSETWGPEALGIVIMNMIIFIIKVIYTIISPVFIILSAILSISVVLLKSLGIYQSFNRKKFMDTGITLQNFTDIVAIVILLINIIVVSIIGIKIFNFALSIVILVGISIRHEIKKYYKLNTVIENSEDKYAL